jgi:hypothetical protein
MMSDAEYIRSEFAKILLAPKYQITETFRLKVTGEDGETRWLSISKDQMLKVIRALTE